MQGRDCLDTCICKNCHNRDGMGLVYLQDKENKDQENKINSAPYSIQVDKSPKERISSMCIKKSPPIGWLQDEVICDTSSSLWLAPETSRFAVPQEVSCSSLSMRFIESTTSTEV